MVWAKTHQFKLGLDDGSKVCMSVGYGPQFWVWKALGPSLARHYYNFQIYQVIFSQYICSQYVGKTFINGLTKKNASLKKLLSVIYGMSVSLLVIILPIDLLTLKAQQKIFYPFYFVGISISEYNISPTKKTLYNSIDDCFCLTGFHW